MGVSPGPESRRGLSGTTLCNRVGAHNGAVSRTRNRIARPCRFNASSAAKGTADSLVHHSQAVVRERLTIHLGPLTKKTTLMPPATARTRQ